MKYSILSVFFILYLFFGFVKAVTINKTTYKKLVKKNIINIKTKYNDTLSNNSDLLQPTPTTTDKNYDKRGLLNARTLPGGGGTCPTNIIDMGYSCCPSGCVVVYVDKYGFWGVRNNQWCGCGGGSYYGSTCSYQILNAGYRCCSYSNCRLITKDSMGRWGVENNKWCGLTNHCIT